MFNLFKKKEKSSKVEQGYKFVWYDIGEGNPFNKRVLDCRDFTQTNLATTADPKVVQTFNRLRQSDGKEYVKQEVDKKSVVEVNLNYPPTKSELNGLVFKAMSFDEKWDIYVYDKCFYFVRSWTGELVYKAFARTDVNHVTIYRIEYVDSGPEESAMAISNVHFLLTTQVLKGIFPHRVPTMLKSDMEIAQYSFSQFGNKCWYATYDDISDTIIKTKDR